MKNALTEEDLALREGRITSSRLAAVLGLLPWANPLDAYLEILGQVVVESNEAMERGSWMEDVLRDWYCDQTGDMVELVKTRVHPDYDWMASSCDGLVHSGSALLEGEYQRAVLECKTSGIGTWPFWGDPGTDEVPTYIVPQLMMEMDVFGPRVAEVVADVRCKFRRHLVHFDQELWDMYLEAAWDFKRDHLDKRIPPDPEGSKKVMDWLATRQPRDTLEKVDSTPEFDVVAERLRTVQRIKGRLEEEEEAIKARIMLSLEGHAGVKGAWGSLSYTQRKGKRYTDWKAIAAMYAGGCVPDKVVQTYTRRGKPSRPLVPHWRKGT